jgi:hypothetical protein
LGLLPVAEAPATLLPLGFFARSMVATLDCGVAAEVADGGAPVAGMATGRRVSTGAAAAGSLTLGAVSQPASSARAAPSKAAVGIQVVVRVFIVVSYRG